MNNGKARLYDHESKLWFDRKIERALIARDDREREKRLERQECPYCHYFSSKLGGAAMTSWECALCDTGALAGSTNTPVLCWDCAKEEDRCRTCGDRMFYPSNN